MANGGQAVSADELDQARVDDAHASAPATTGEGPILARADATPVPAQHTMTRERDGEEDAAAVSSSELEEVADDREAAPLEDAEAPAPHDAAAEGADGGTTAEAAALPEAAHAAPPAGAPQYGPGHTLVGAPLFHDDDAIGEPPSTNPMSAPTRPFDPASPEPAGRQRITPGPVAGSIAVAPTSIEDEHDAGFPVPASSAPTTERDRVGTNTAPLPFGPAQVVASFGGVYPRVPPPPAAAVKPRRAKEGPSMMVIAAVAFLVIGGVTTGAMMIGRTRAGDSTLAPPATAPVARPTAPVSVPVEDAPATARAVSDAPTMKPVARPPTRRPWTKPPPSNQRVNPGKTSQSAPSATHVPQVSPSTQPPPAALPPQPQDPTGQPPQATDPSPSPTSSARHRRGQ